MFVSQVILGHNFWTISDRNFVCGIHTQPTNIFQRHQGQCHMTLKCDLYSTNSSAYVKNQLWQKAKSRKYQGVFEVKSASYEYRKMSARRGAQFVPIGMPTVCWKTFPAKTTKILSTRNSSILMMSSSEYLLLESECSFTKYVSSCPNTKYLYLRLPFLKMKAFRIILVSLSFNFWWGMVV